MKSFKQFTEDKSSLFDQIQDLGDNASPEKQKAFIDKHLVQKQELPSPEYKEAEVLDLSANRLADLDIKDGEDEEVYESVQEGTVSEAEMTDAQKEKREVIVKELKKKMSEFKDRYGDKATDVMYATATKMAMKDDSEDEDEDELEEGYYKEGVLKDLEMIVKKKSALDVKFSDGKKQKVDLTTASMIVSMVKQLNKQNQKKVLNMLDNSKTFKDVAKFAFSAGK
jgi:predicted DNA-binding antitoxin AbrB/MazE fold protein